MSTKTEIQARIDKCESDLSSLKADLSKCDCEDKAQAEGIEQEKCWFGVTDIGDCMSSLGRTKGECKSHMKFYRPVYMPECRQVTAEDAVYVQQMLAKSLVGQFDDFSPENFAIALHKAGFRMKVNP